MYQSIHKPLRGSFFRYFFLVMVLAGLSACGSTAERSKYVAFAEAGVAYNQALVSVTDATIGASVDANNEELIDYRMTQEGTPDPDALKNRLATSDSQLEGKIKKYKEAKKLLAALDTYFKALAGLAKSDAPKKFNEEVKAASKNLGTVFNALNGSPSPIPNGAVEFFSGAFNRALDKTLKGHLEENEQLLNAVFDFLDERLGVLGDDLENANRTFKSMNYGRTVRRPFVDDNFGEAQKLQDSFAKQRKFWILFEEKSTEVKKAEKASKELKKVYEKLLKDAKTLDLKEIDALTAEFATLIKFLEGF